MRALIIILILSATLATALDSQIAGAATKCCPKAAFDCCYEAIEFRLRLSSCHQIPEADEAKAVQCVHKELHGEEDMAQAGWNHMDCCDAFNYDHTDSSLRCYQACRFVMATPSMHSKTKLNLIKECRIKNPLNRCFEVCRKRHNDLTAKNQTVPAYLTVESDACARLKMKEGELYAINQIMKF